MEKEDVGVDMKSLKLVVVETKSSLDILKIAGSPPVVEYSIQVYNNIRIVCNFRGDNQNEASGG